MLLPLPRLQVDTEKEAKKEEMARAVLAGGSLLLDDDPFKGMSPQVWLSMLSCVLVSGWLAVLPAPVRPAGDPGVQAHGDEQQRMAVQPPMRAAH